MVCGDYPRVDARVQGVFCRSRVLPLVTCEARATQSARNMYWRLLQNCFSDCT